MLRTFVLTIYLHVGTIHGVEITPFSRPHAKALVQGLTECVYLSIDMVHELLKDGVRAEATCHRQDADDLFVDANFGLARGWRSARELDVTRNASESEGAINRGQGPTRARARILIRQQESRVR